MYFLCQLLPPRPTFMQDMSPAELALMQSHAAYWTGFAEERKAIVFGPVADPKGGWGLGIVEVASEAEVKAMTAKDPVILANQGFAYDIHLMPRAIVRK